MSARGEVKLNLDAIYKLLERIRAPGLAAELDSLSYDPGVAAIVSQAVAENFELEGPGWAALKNQTIRRSVPKKMKKKIGNLSGKELKRREHLTRKYDRSPEEETELESLDTKAGISGESAKQPSRAILQRSGFLKKSATTLGAQGNVYLPQRNKLVWGTDLAYAGIHNQGGTIHHPGTEDGFGKKKYEKVGKKFVKKGGVKIKPHGIKIPEREFMFLSNAWLEELQVYVANAARKIIAAKMRGDK